MMEPAEFTRILDGIRAGVMAAARLPDDRVIWKFENADAPPLSYATISLGADLTIGQDYLDPTYDAARPNGQEIELRVRGLREVPLEVECFTASVSDGSSALGLGRLVKASLLLPSVRAIFAAVNVSPFDPGPVNYIPDVPSVGFRGRSSCTIRCYMPPPFVAEYIGYIASVSATMNTTGGQQPSNSRSFTVP